MKSYAMIVCAAVAWSQAGVLPERGSKLKSYTKDAEIALALSAGPEHFKETAGVWILGPKEFENLRESRNGFNCLVTRGHDGTQEPQCFDAEGTRTLMKEAFLEARLMREGMSAPEIRRAVADAYAKGELRAPSRPGINYMLSNENFVVADESTGRVVQYPGHVMFYAPYLTNADVGAGKSSPVFVINEGKPGAYIIVPTGRSGH